MIVDWGALKGCIHSQGQKPWVGGSTAVAHPLTSLAASLVEDTPIGERTRFTLNQVLPAGMRDALTLVLAGICRILASGSFCES